MKDRQMDDMTSELKDLKNKCVIQNRLIQVRVNKSDYLPGSISRTQYSVKRLLNKLYRHVLVIGGDIYVLIYF